ncbi:MAG: DUF389 domain-containing protein, partial [Novosphingobium sp.]|nr:DUF389 domain-containing protein [Novosphingobium sp.]
IGVAIATALMPPLATLGYGLGVLELRFAMGAFLLFLTNLAAITFSFALIARLSGAARPLRAVEMTPRYIAVMLAAFLALATPLSMTLIRIKHEATMQSAARNAILAATGQSSARIAQLEVSWPLFGDPRVEALVITPSYTNNAVKDAEKRLAEEMGEKVTINLQQVLAADLESQTRAIVDAAMERTVAGLSADVPPLDRIRGRIGLPTRAVWTNRTGRIVYVEPVPAPEWTLADYGLIEQQANSADDPWTVMIVPPATSQLRVPLDEAPRDGDESNNKKEDEKEAIDTVPVELAIWALQRWGMAKVTLTAPEGDAGTKLAKTLRAAGIIVTRRTPPPSKDNGEEKVALIEVYSPSPTRLAEEAAKAKAEAEAKAKAEAEAKAKEAAEAKPKPAGSAAR